MTDKIMLRIAAAALALMSAATHAGEPTTFDIPPGDLAAALEQVARQTGLELIFQPAELRGIQTQGVTGKLSPEEAVTKLIHGTRLTIKTDTAGAILISAPKSTTSNVEEIDLRGIPEILVRGKRTINADIERTEDDSQPYVVFDRGEIDRSPASNLEEFFKSQLPMNTLQGSGNQRANNAFGNASSVNLRGLGTNQTLMLVDGRRMASINAFGAFGQPDVNAIPLAAVERVEILPSTASGIYGGGATGGVVNVITRKDYEGLDARVKYGNTFRTDAGNYQVDGGVGFELEDGRTHLMIAASHAEADELQAEDRDLLAQARALQLRNNPGAFSALTTPPSGYTPNIRSQDGSNLQLDPQYGGAQLSSPFTSVPVGYAGVASDNGAALAANAGRYNLDLPADLLGTEQSLLSETEASSAVFNVRREFGDRIEAFLDTLWLHNESHFAFANVPTTAALPANAPNNPFTTAIRVRFPATGLSYHLDSRSDAIRTAAGVIVRLPGDWTAETDYVWSRSRFSNTSTDPVLGDLDGTGPDISGSTALNNGALDVMRDLNTFPLDFGPYQLPSPSFIQTPSDVVLNDLNLRLSGPVLTLPGGPLTLSALLEHRKETAEQFAFKQIDTATTSSLTVYPERSQTVDSLYLEARAPLVPLDVLPSVRSLELQASVRRDEYETRVPNPTNYLAPLTSTLRTEVNEVEATKYNLGLRYEPLDGLTLRASLGTGFLPPSVDQLVPITSDIPPFTVVDPKRGGVAAEIGPIRQTTGGNPNLKPEDSKSWSVGFVLNPASLRNLRLSLDYTNIEKSDEIVRWTSTQQIIDLEDVLPGRITRAPLTPQEQALGYTGGAITAINATLINFTASKLEAWDLQANYTIEAGNFGDFHLSAVATWQPHLQRQTDPTSAFVELAGYSGGILERRGNAGASWQRGPWEIGWNTQYFDSYYRYSSIASAASIAASILNQGAAKVRSQTYHDLSVRYRFDESSTLLSGALNNTEVMLSLQNVFDEEPPVLATTGTNSYYSAYGDPRLRRFSLTVRKQF